MYDSGCKRCLIFAVISRERRLGLADRQRAVARGTDEPGTGRGDKPFELLNKDVWHYAIWERRREMG